MKHIINIKKPNKNKMCDVGFHVVKGHYRVCQSGTKTWVDAHQRKNRGHKEMYLEENLLFIYWKNEKNYRPLNGIKGYSAHHELDSIIQFWLEYWKKQGEKFPKGLTPLHVKALIAVESSFRPKARPKTSSARGLMQVLSTARTALRGTSNTRNNEVRNNYIDISPKQSEDPVINIASGTRWLAHKFFLLRNRKDKSLRTVIRNYHSKTKEGDKYAEKVLSYYNNSK